MTACRSPIGFERLVAYWTGDVAADDSDAIELHLFGCDACTREAEQVARISRGFRSEIAPVISLAELEGLRAKGLVLGENDFVPGARAVMTFERDADVMIHHLRGLDLGGAARVDVVVRSETAGVMLEDHFVPFDPDRGEVIIACQRHFQELPHDVVFDVHVHRGAAPPTVSTYFVPHAYA